MWLAGRVTGCWTLSTGTDSAEGSHGQLSMLRCKAPNLGHKT